jgi:hypothetical protein
LPSSALKKSLPLTLVKTPRARFPSFHNVHHSIRPRVSVGYTAILR